MLGVSNPASNRGRAPFLAFLIFRHVQMCVSICRRHDGRKVRIAAVRGASCSAPIAVTEVCHVPGAAAWENRHPGVRVAVLDHSQGATSHRSRGPWFLLARMLNGIVCSNAVMACEGACPR